MNMLCQCLLVAQSTPRNYRILTGDVLYLLIAFRMAVSGVEDLGRGTRNQVRRFTFDANVLTPRVKKHLTQLTCSEDGADILTASYSNKPVQRNPKRSVLRV